MSDAGQPEPNNQNEQNVPKIAEFTTRRKYTRRKFKSMLNISTYVTAIVWKEMQEGNKVISKKFRIDHQIRL